MFFEKGKSKGREGKGKGMGLVNGAFIKLKVNNIKGAFEIMIS